MVTFEKSRWDVEQKEDNLFLITSMPFKRESLIFSPRQWHIQWETVSILFPTGLNKATFFFFFFKQIFPKTNDCGCILHVISVFLHKNVHSLERYFSNLYTFWLF